MPSGNGDRDKWGHWWTTCSRHDIAYIEREGCPNCRAELVESPDSEDGN